MGSCLRAAISGNIFRRAKLLRFAHMVISQFKLHMYVPNMSDFAASPQTVYRCLIKFEVFD